MLRNHNIICFAPSDWWTMNPSCTTHIMKKLTRRNRVLYINPFSSTFSGAAGTRIITRTIRKATSIARFLGKPQKNLYVFSPVFLPLHNNSFIDTINSFLLKFQIKGICRLLKFSKPILWVENLRASDALGWFDAALTVYHLSDLFEDCLYSSNKSTLLKREQTISEQSDVLICVSQKLYEAKSSDRKNVYYLPHGVDFRAFRYAAENSNGFDEKLAQIPRPIAGYFGTMTRCNDIDTMLWCARSLPDVSFVFAGQITSGDYRQLLKLENVYFLGKLPYRQIPKLCACFDVCLLQWKMDEWIKYCNPLKTFEYMASGKPIVSVPIYEIAQKYSDIVSIAETKEQFANAILTEINNDTEQRRDKRLRIARQNSWDNHIEHLSNIINIELTAKNDFGKFH